MTQNKRKLAAATWIICTSLVLLTVATYAWMTIATSFKISDMELNVVTDNAMELALDQNGLPGEWTTVLSLGELLQGQTALRPVTWSASQGIFLAPRYGLDGRPSFLEPIPLQLPEAGISSLSDPLGTGVGYLIKLDLWIRVGSSQASVYLSEPQKNGDGLGGGTYVVGAPIWDAQSVLHRNGGKGAENAIRIGFLTYDEEYDAGSFIIYEPNVREDEPPTFSVDGTGLAGDGKLIQQAPSTWSEQDPILHGSVNYQMGSFISSDTTLFKLEAGVPRRLTIFIWLEGQDSACTNSISAAQIIANIQFAASTGDDLEDIIRPERGKAYG